MKRFAAGMLLGTALGMSLGAVSREQSRKIYAKHLDRVLSFAQGTFQDMLNRAGPYVPPEVYQQMIDDLDFRATLAGADIATANDLKPDA